MIDAIRAMAPARRGALVRSLEALASAIGANAVQPRMLFEDEPPPPPVRRARAAPVRRRARLAVEPAPRASPGRRARIQ
jgi:hypothetical protein